MSQKKLTEDFRVFMWLCFKTMGLNPHSIQYEAGNWLVTSSSRVVFSCMREFGKTIMVASYICWRLYKDPNYMCIVQCANQEKAESIVRLVKTLLEETPQLAHLAPTREEINSATKFNVRTKTSVTRECSVSAYGSASEITGAHVHEVIADDLETRENSLTDLRRERILELIREYEDLLMSNNPDCRVIVIGTPQSEMSIYFTLAEQGYEMMRLPSRYPELDDVHIDTLAPFLLKKMKDPEDRAAIPQAPTYPERKPEEYLVKKEFLQGPKRFQLQELLNPSLSDEDLYPLKLRDLIVYDSDLDHFPVSMHWSNLDTEKIMLPNPGLREDGFYAARGISEEYTEFKKRVMWVDPSGSGSDEVAWTVAMAIPGWIYIPHTGGVKEAFDDSTLNRIALAAKKYKVHEVWVEPNYGGGAYRKLLEPVFKRLGVTAALEDDKWTTGRKSPRIIDVLRPIMGSHKLVISTDVARDTTWGQQVTRLIYDDDKSLPHDDRVESTWGAVKHLLEFVQEQSLDETVDYEYERRKKAIEEYWGISPTSEERVLQSDTTKNLGYR